MPLWNFFKIVETADLKYLIRLPERFDYDNYTLHNASEAMYVDLWDKILDEFSKLENASGLNEQRFNRSKLLIHWAKYIQEQAMIKSLFFRTDVEYIKELRARGYRIPKGKDFTTMEDFQQAYWDSLNQAAKRVHHHITFMQSLSIKLEQGKKDSDNAGSPYDEIMAWIASNNIIVDENITVKRYVEVKKIIHNRIKSLEKSRKHGGRRA